MYEHLLPDKKRAWISLYTISGIGHATILKLFNHFGDLERIFEAKRSDLESLGWLTQSKILNILKGPDEEKVNEIIKKLNKFDTRVITYNDPEYPPQLKEITLPPCMLFVRGKIELLNTISVSIVGTRKFSTYGKKVTEDLTKALVNKGVTIISGLAKGIDSIAHATCLKNNGNTIAVKGCGIDVYYPKEHAQLENEIASKGLVITEFLPGTQPDAHNFPLRNRVISALSRGVIVVEAPRKSGALITAHYALDQGKSVMAVPGNIYSETSKGCHWLIKEGAVLVEDVDDVLNEINVSVKKDTLPINPNLIIQKDDALTQLTDEERLILELLKEKELHIDEITIASKLSAEKISSILTQLELKDLVEALPGQIYKSLIN